MDDLKKEQRRQILKKLEERVYELKKEIEKEVIQKITNS